MDRLGRIAVILVSLLLAGLASQVCHGQLAAPPHSIPPPRPGSDFGKSERRDAEPTATDVRSPILLFPELEDRLLAAARASTEHWLRVKLVTSAQLPGQSSSPTSTPVGAPLPPALDLRQSSEPTATSSGDEPPVDLAFAHLKRAPLEPTDFGFPINLATALRLSDARPLIVAAAQASVWVAEAQLTRAKVLWVPTLKVGADYIRHDGGGPDFNKGILTSPSVNYFQAGGGLDVSNSGLFQFVNLTDAFFEPLVAQRVLVSRQADIQAAKNDALLMTANAYFSVHQHRGKYAAALYCVERGHDLVDQIASLSEEMVSKVEVERARNLLADLESASRFCPPGLARAECQSHSGPPVEPRRGGRPARARSSSAHTD